MKPGKGSTIEDMLLYILRQPSPEVMLTSKKRFWEYLRALHADDTCRCLAALYNAGARGKDLRP